MPGKYRSSFAPAIATIFALTFLGTPAMSQQSVQHNQTDLDFTSRLVSETDRMQMQVRELSARVSALEAPATSSSQSQMTMSQSAATASTPATGSPEQIRHRDRAVSIEDLEQIKARLGTIDYKVVQEQRRLNAADSVDADQQTASMNNLRQLSDELQRLDDVVATLESANR